MAANNNSNGGDWLSWLPIIILFCIPTTVTKIIAAIWLISKLWGKKGNVKRHPYDLQHDGQDREQAAWEDGAPNSQSQNAAQNETTRQTYTVRKEGKTVTVETERAKTAGKSGGRKFRGKRQSGTGLTIAGAIVAGIFGLGTMGALADFMESLNYGYFFSDDLVGVIACALFFAGGLFMLGAGISMSRRSERYVNYLAYIGANREVALAPMAAAFGVSVNQLCKDLRRMLAKGVLPTGYLDLAEGKLFLTEMGHREPERPREEPKVEPQTAQAEEQEDAILREIRQVNDAIPDEVMTEKINRIEEITGKILAYQKAHPDREGQLRTFLNYYLPTTLKILRAYAQLDAQGIEGENISAAKARIEGMMDQVVAGFEKQLDKLFQGDAMDVTSDVEVLENMLKKDGLSDGQGMTMGL
jgi:hypothetical protein